MVGSPPSYLFRTTYTMAKMLKVGAWAKAQTFDLPDHSEIKTRTIENSLGKKCLNIMVETSCT